MNLDAFRKDLRERLSNSYNVAREGMGLPPSFQDERTELEEEGGGGSRDPKTIMALKKANQAELKALNAELAASKNAQNVKNAALQQAQSQPIVASDDHEEYDEASYFTPNSFDPAGTNTYQSDNDTFFNAYQDDLMPPKTPYGALEEPGDGEGYDDGFGNGIGDEYGGYDEDLDLELDERNDPISVKSMRNVLKFASPEQISGAIAKMDVDELNHFLSNLQQDAIEVLSSKVDNNEGGDMGAQDDGMSDGSEAGGNLALGDL